ncbi:hypothetical protein KUTeg_001332 [Tegillarca granosa]|uniref:Uncharacterized protein n=1 Tax=Tegillarca granosa TaxID=220873 RepID=A0ABQ9FR90_TEGGR|nr:hypothetical protein KUTeg_001332 [Tegillarca granosa]
MEHLYDFVSFTIVCLCIVLVFADDNLVNGDWWAILLVCIFGIPIFVLVYSIWRQPQNQAEINFKCIE